MDIQGYGDALCTGKGYGPKEIKSNSPIRVKRIDDGKKHKAAKYMTGVTTCALINNLHGYFIEAKCSGVNYFCQWNGQTGEWVALNIAKQSSKGKW